MNKINYIKKHTHIGEQNISNVNTIRWLIKEIKYEFKNVNS